MKILAKSNIFRRTRSGAVIANVWLSVGDSAFPHVAWDDFAIVVLTAFADAVFRLTSGSRSETVYFMEGPFTVHLQRDGSGDVSIEGFERDQLRFSVRMSVVDLAATVEEAGSKLLSWCRERNWLGRDEEALESALRKIKLS